MRIGIDFGGTKIEGIALAADGREVARKRIASPRGDYAASIEAIADLVEAIERDTGQRGSVGLGIPGCLSPATRLVKNANSTWLIGQDLKADIEARLAREVRIENDANCLAVSEATDGAAAGAALVFAVILGTGVGGGVALEGRPWVGPNAIAGEWGHTPLPRPDAGELPGPECYCGRRGCLETWLSGPGLLAGHRGEPFEDAEALFAAAAEGQPEARETYQRWLDRLARGLAVVANILDPQVIVLGGGLSRVAPLYEDLPPLLAAEVFSDRFTTPIRAARHGDASGVRGAAWLWPDDQDRFEEGSAA